MSATPFVADGPCRAAVIQLCSGPDVAANLRRTEALLAEAAAAGARVALLPENVLFLRLEDDALAPILFPESDAMAALAAAARRHGMWILVGSVTEDSGDPARPFNTSVLLDDEGVVRATYRKLHLFSLFGRDGRPILDEGRTISPGRRAAVAATPLGWLGLSICYDLRFPEIYRAHVAHGATALAVPAAFTERTGRVHWRPLLVSRAIENQAYVLAAAQTGHHGGNRRSWGHSLIVDPWGDVVAELGPDEGVTWADLDPGVVAEMRGRVPSVADMRLSVDVGVDRFG